jgi:hypothetical protein
MKRELFFTFIFILYTTNSFAIKLHEAIILKKVTAQFKSTNEHSGKCITVLLNNNTKYILDIELDAGTLLDNLSEEAQDIILTENLITQLAPRSKQTGLLNGCCVIQHNRCPNSTDSFIIAASKNKATIQLAQLIANTPTQGYTEQEAFWCLTNENDIADIIGSDSIKVMKYRNFVGTVLNKPIPRYDAGPYTRSASVINSSLEIETNGKLILTHIKANDIIETALYDEEGNIVSQIIKDKCIQPYGSYIIDRHKHNYNIVTSNLQLNKKYFLRVKVNGVVQREYMYQA